MSKTCNKQFITLGHCEIWCHFTRILYFHSPSACDNTDATREISRHICRDVASDADRHLDITFGLQVVESSSCVSVPFREAFSIPTSPFFIY